MNQLREQLPNCPFYIQYRTSFISCDMWHTYSKNKESLVIVMDGGGEMLPTYQETESIYVINSNEILQNETLFLYENYP